MEAEVRETPCTTSLLDAVASLWGTEEPSMGLTAPREASPVQQKATAVLSGPPDLTISDDKLKDLPLSGAVASLWGTQDPGLGVPTPALDPSSNSVPATAQQASRPAAVPSTTAAVILPSQIPAVDAVATASFAEFNVEPVFSNLANPARRPSCAAPPQAKVVAAPAAASLLRSPAMPSAPPRTLAPGHDVDFQPSSSFMGSRRGFVFKIGDKGLGYYRDRQPHIHQVQSPWGMKRVDTSFPHSPSDAVTLEKSHGIANGWTTTVTRSATGIDPPCQSLQGARDRGRRMAGSSEDPAVDIMEFAQPGDLEHLDLPDEEEASMVLAQQLPPPGARDLGPHCQWASAGDLHPMAMDYLPMVDQVDRQPPELAPPPPPQAMRPRVQVREDPPDPAWVLAAPQVAQDLKRAACYWPDPLRQAQFCGAVDHGRSKPPPPEEEPNYDRLPDLAPYGQRVFVEERWDESRMIYPGADVMHPGSEAYAQMPPQHPATWRAPIGYQQSPYPFGLGQADTLPSGDSLNSRVAPQSAPWTGTVRNDPVSGLRGGALGEMARVSPADASKLAARLGNVIANLERGDAETDTAVGDLREIQATYNSALNSQIGS